MPGGPVFISGSIMHVFVVKKLRENSKTNRQKKMFFIEEFSLSHFKRANLKMILGSPTFAFLKTFSFMDK